VIEVLLKRGVLFPIHKNLELKLEVIKEQLKAIL